MGLKIYRKIDNSTSQIGSQNILLEFVCEVNLCNAYNIFDNCLLYNSEYEEYYDLSECCKDTLKSSVDYLERKMNNFSSSTSYSGVHNLWLEEATRCYNILKQELDKDGRQLYIIFL